MFRLHQRIRNQTVQNFEKVIIDIKFGDIYAVQKKLLILTCVFLCM
jgi:orotidine-5'-phosphate decarboxylase